MNTNEFDQTSNCDRNVQDRGPSRTTWPPAWLTSTAETPAIVEDTAKTTALPANLQPLGETPQAAELSAVVTGPPAMAAEPLDASAAVCRCGSTCYIDLPIHDGRSMRRDCERCGRFISFPVWYDKTMNKH
jgi:hypothetical protein